jgi:hypothetical protein
VGRVIRNRWTGTDGLARAAILGPEDAPEGVEVERLRAAAPAGVALDPARGHVLSALAGAARLEVGGRALSLGVGVHVYLPPGEAAALALEAGAELVHLASRWARGEAVLVRDEAFVASCATDEQSLRWILTPQYLSRRIFLHHDAALLSRSGHPVSWFHTTMFDVEGLPPNEDGEPVFKMSYDSRTEFNVCHDVRGDARVRMATAPLVDRGQTWGPWLALDGDATYHLDEGPVDPATGAPRPRRNKHEVLVRGGHVTLHCLFDPAPTGVERHRPGEYSDYEPFEAVALRDEYRLHRARIERFDAMVDRLSLARAEGRLDAERGGPDWALHEAGRAAQEALERRLLGALAAEGRGRDRVVAPWTLSASPPG